MVPIRTYTNWNSRPSDQKAPIEPYRKYYFICEGANTETWYFQKLIDLRKQLGIHPTIDICLLEKTGSDRDISYPLKLIEFANAQKENEVLSFDTERDKMIIVFDADIFEEKVENYETVLLEGEPSNILGVTNPSFELFLLLHVADSYNSVIQPNLDAIIRNEKTGNQRYIYSLLLQATGINSKKNPEIGKLAESVDIAILQEKNLNQNIHDCRGKVTCNIGQIIEMIRSDHGES